MYWRSLHAANDQFLLYAFDAAEDDVDPLPELQSRPERVADLHLGIDRVPGDLGFPRWTRTPITERNWRRHHVEHWDDCLAAVADLMTPGSREPEILWRIHLFGPLTGVPEAGDRATVVVLQISHALGDGRRVSDIARRLLSDGPEEKRPESPRLPGIIAAGLGAASTVPRLAAATAIGLAAWRDDDPESGLPAVEPTALNLPGDGPTVLRTVTVPRERLRRLATSVTAAVLTVLADVLPQFGGATADGRVIAEVTMAREPVDGQRNNFHTVGIDLSAGAEPGVRAESIARQIDAARRRDGAPARRRARRASALAPAVLDALAVRLAEQAPLPDRVAGTTVVSSVNRGPADLTLSGRPVLFTAGFPALSPVHGLTHGIHGIGDRVTVSIAARGGAAATIDDYAAAIAVALG
ncbi:hypothetical protein ACH46_05775 [Gordonia phthalatica]|uniref:O-acyltransferase WSD1 C-terminal domain-containing protein n=2 Tax=Gordonia phthalatica TaxID=1136941 RepID=A0A0N7FVA8_9ACTN|nr:hypothetical protein ACH46_05775 [Gordonia phthalatica]